MLLIKALSGFVTRVLGAHTSVVDQSRGLQTPFERVAEQLPTFYIKAPIVYDTV